MRAPRPRAAPIDAARMRTWLGDFGSYRYPVNELRIRDWLNQFDARHQDMAARVLDIIDYFGNDRISIAYRQSLSSLQGWHKEASRRSGKWRFAAMSQSAGESGDSMLHLFRIANKLREKKYNELFVRPSELIHEQLGADDTIVLLDDFVGTGKQVCDAWRDAFSELVVGCGTVYLIVVAAFRTGFDRIHDETELNLVASHRLNEGDNFFSNQCHHFRQRRRRPSYVLRASQQANTGRLWELRTCCCILTGLSERLSCGFARRSQ